MLRPKQPEFQVFTSATPKNTGIDLSTIFKIKNFGISPAFKVAPEIKVEMRDSKSIHHTKFWITSYMIPENAAPAVIERKAIYTRFTLPIGGWYLVKSEAD